MLQSKEKNDAINSISSGSKLEGDLTSTGDVRIDGLLQGSLKTDGKLVLGENGTVDGEVNCKSAMIAGEIKGSIQAAELLTLKTTAKISGEIVANKLAIEPGALFSGTCSMGPVIKNITGGSKTNTAKKEKSA